MHSLGLNIGSTSIKLVMLESNSILWHAVMPHEGDVKGRLLELIQTKKLPSDLPALVAGTHNSQFINLPSVLEAECIEEAIKHISDEIQAVVSLGGEDSVLYQLDEAKKVSNCFSGNKCASGTGEFFRQQIKRMNMGFDEIQNIPVNSKAHKMSGRCSVFMKSDCTHKLNKGEATKDDIVVSLSSIMAGKAVDFIKRAKIEKGTILLTGGVMQNPFIIQAIKESLPDIKFIIPPQHTYFEAYGAALLAEKKGIFLPDESTLIKDNIVHFARFPSLKSAENMVTYYPSRRGKMKPGKDYILGVDGGSTTTKACLVDADTLEICCEHYARTYGDPINAFKRCLQEIKNQIKEQIADNPYSISLAAVTGSSREILGVFIGTTGVYNEIIAHAAGTVYFNKNADTIFEIGGQDAKYVNLKNMVPVDYAMNEACSAGTGSFLEESASGDLSILDPSQIGEIALKADSPLRFGEHCSAFINSDIRKAIAQGAAKRDITAGIITSIVMNYLNRVVGNRSIGETLFLQGGVAKNKAVPQAFALLLKKHINVPGDPELMGCFGAAVMARQKSEQNHLERANFSLEKLLIRELQEGKNIKCLACDNSCIIKEIFIDDKKYLFGGRCSKYSIQRKKKISNSENTSDNARPINYIKLRNDLLFKQSAPDPANFIQRSELTVGIPKCFTTYSLWPFFSWFFHTLGIKYFLSKNISPEGFARVESSYCFPAEIAHGAVQDLVDHKVDLYFLPHVKYLLSYEKDVHANFCPITQSLSFYIKKAFPEIKSEQILAPTINFKEDEKDTLESYKQMSKVLKRSKNEIKEAFYNAFKKQQHHLKKISELGLKAQVEALKKYKDFNIPSVVLCGRPYNAFSSDANMGIPEKFISRGHTVIPFDILPFAEKKIFPNMYWFYGQQNMKTAQLVKDSPGIFMAYISNFSCAPDSFMLHYLKWYMQEKPYLTLELDSHSADAGIDTRIEAFLDIIESNQTGSTTVSDNIILNKYKVLNYQNEMQVFDQEKNDYLPVINNPKIKILIANMGHFSVELLSEILAAHQIGSIVLPVATSETLHQAKKIASGKECVPSLLMLGSTLQFIYSEQYSKDDIYLLFVPITTGPCRTGQYYIYFENLFKQLSISNIATFSLNADTSYNELGSDFFKKIWLSIIIGDYMKDIEAVINTASVNKKESLIQFDLIWKSILSSIRNSPGNIYKELKNTARKLKKIQLIKSVKNLPRILIVGEIYVRRDDFASHELVKNISSRGIIPKVAGVSEWIYYIDYVLKNEIKRKIKKVRWYRRIYSKPFFELIKFYLEKIYKLSIEYRIYHILRKSDLLPVRPSSMNQIMKKAEADFVHKELNSEITVSCGAAGTAVSEGYSGIINISPFSCLIGRVIEGIMEPWCRIKKIPMMSVEIDGSTLPSALINKLEIFLLKTGRFYEINKKNRNKNKKVPKK